MTHFGDQPPPDTGTRPAGDGTARHETVLDVGTERVARVYAEALLRAAKDHKQVDEILEELQAFIEHVFTRDPQFEVFLASGAVGRERKAAVIHSTFAGRASELFVNFLLVLNDHERLDLLRPIASAYRELRDQQAGLMRVQIRSAVPLPEDQRERLRVELRKSFRKEPLLEAEVDPDLLGGIVVRVDDWLFDGSVRSQLQTIRNQIIARSSYEIQSRRDRFSSPNGD